MYRNRIPLMVLALLLLTAAKGFSEWPAWIDKDKIRGAFDFGHVDDRGHFAKLAANGINTLIVSFAGLDVDKPEEIALLDKQADWCAELGLHLFVNTRLCGDKPESRYLIPGGRCYVDSNGFVFTKTPCPIDPVFWEAVATRRAQLVAEHSLTHKIDGWGLDPEMYGADQAEITGSGYCSCEYCFREFLQHRGLQVPVPLPDTTWPWLQQQGLGEFYEAWEKQQAEALARKTEQAIHKLNPDLLIGILLLDINKWYYNAWARGFGTPRMPVIAFSARTYETGATKYPLRASERFRKIGAHAVLCPGMYLRKFPTEDIAGQLFYMAQNSAGYWLFTTYGLAMPPEEVPTNDYSWLPPHQQYLDAFRLASEELDRQKQEDGKFTPKLKLVPRQESPQAILAEAGQPLSSATMNLQPLDPKGQDARPAEEPNHLRYEAVFYIPATAGEAITAILTSYPEGILDHAPVYTLISPSGKIMAKGTLLLSNPPVDVDLNVAAAETGLYKLALKTKANLFSAAINMPHAVQSINDTFSVVQRTLKMYFYVPEDCAEFFIKVGTPYTAEQARLVVWDPAGKEAANAQTTELIPAHAVVATTPAQRGKVWSFQILPADHGAFYSGDLIWDPRLPPYLAESPEAMLLPVAKKSAGAFIRFESNPGDYVAIDGVFDYGTVGDGVRDIVLLDGEHTVSYYQTSGITTYYEAKLTVEKGLLAKPIDSPTSAASSWRMVDNTTVSCRGPNVKMIGMPGQSIYYGHLNGKMTGSTVGEATIRMSDGDWVIYCSDWTTYYWARITIANGVVASVDGSYKGPSNWHKVDDTTVSLR